MTAREYLDQIVKPNVADFEKDYADVRKAMNAVQSVDAFAAHIYHGAGGRTATGEKDDTAFRETLATRDADFNLLRDVAKAAKHVVLDRGSPIVTKAEQVSSKSLGYGETRYGEGRYGSPLQAVVVTNAGEHRVLETVVRNTLAFLEAEMTAYKL